MKTYVFPTYSNSEYEIRFWCEDLTGRDHLLQMDYLSKDNGGKIMRVEHTTDLYLYGLTKELTE